MDAGVERIALEAKVLQDGFEILTRCKSLEEMAGEFCRLIQGSLGIHFANAYYCNHADAGFKPLHLQKPMAAPLTSLSQLQEHFEIRDAPDGTMIFASLLHTDASRMFMVIGPKLDASLYSEWEKISIQLFLQLWDHAYQNYLRLRSERQLIFSLNHRLTQLDRLIESGFELSKLNDTKSLLTSALERMIVITSASRGAVHADGNNEACFLQSLPYRFVETPSMQQLEKGEAIQASISYRDKKITFTLFDKETRFGHVRFETTDEALVNALTRHVLITLENDFLLQQMLEKNHIEQELSLASEIQQAILPKQFPNMSGYDIDGLNLPSKEVSGDYFDCYKLNDDRLALIIADVSGKGFPAALLVSTLHASLRAYLENNLTLPNLTAKLNRMICHSSTDEKFITFFIAILNGKKGEMEYLNAGHNPILLWRNGNVEKIVSGGMALGVLDKPFEWKSGRTPFEPGDRLLLYTDGIPESINENEDFFTDEALENFFIANESLTSKDFSNKLISTIKSFSSNTPQQDDITLLYLKRNR